MIKDILSGILISLMVISFTSETFVVVGQEKVIQTRKRRGNSPTSNQELNNTTKVPGNGMTSAEARRRQEAAKKEIRQTEEQIRTNDARVKTALNELGVIDGEISSTQRKIKETNNVLIGLTKKISTLEENITKQEEDLLKLREEYLKAIKKMRLTKNNKSELAFVFSSDNFNQAMRRVRYMKEFSAWKERQSGDINALVAELKGERAELAKSREEQRKALAMQKINNSELLKQHNRQEELLTQLKSNGAALDRHLKQKQAEANDLGVLVNQLIAREQETERQKRLQETQMSQEKKVEDNRKLQNNSTTKPNKTNSSTKVNDKKNNKKEKTDNKKNNKEEFASARKRKPRTQSVQTTQSDTEVIAEADNGFYSMKGRLPKPVSGKFIITSHFGRQNTSDMTDVEYQNPGIDAEVDLGSEAQAVYSGKVSGVYLLPGYNTVVIVNHDGYYTVYGNISSALVKVGQKVVAGQKLGLLSTAENDPNKGSIHFEVWRNRDKQNPEDWIRR